MNTIPLPQALNLKSTSPIQLFDYRIYTSCLKSKINLTKNTFSFLKVGTKEIITNNKPITIKNDEFLIIKSGKCLMTETISASNQSYNSILLFFTKEAVLDFLEKNKLEFEPSKKSDAFAVCQYDTYIKQFVESLESINQLNKHLQKKLLQIKFEEIMTYLVQKEGTQILGMLLGEQDNQLASLINVVENNKLKKLTLQELSFLSNMSLSTFKRAFSKHYQTTPSKWFQEQRLKHAAFLLSTLKKRPIDLFEDAGYDRLSNFIQAFKKEYGMTPKQFQQKK